MPRKARIDALGALHLVMWRDIERRKIFRNNQERRRMRLLFWYCDRFAWHPSMKTLDHAPEAAPMTHEQTVVAFVHVEPPDVVDGS